MRDIFSASAMSVSVIQVLSLLFTIIGFSLFEFEFSNLILILIGYFLYSGIGVSLMLHRYYTHRSFSFNNKFIEKIFLFFSIVSGRGSPLGWVYVHRLHHAYSDTEKDPHDAERVKWKIFLPHLLEYGKKIDKKIVKDLFNREQLFINQYYLIFILTYAVLLAIIDLQIFYFFYIVPLMLTWVALDLFVALTHKYGYRNFTTKDKSTNNWFIALILWGEGWHNNHHYNPGSYSTKVKWWEVDLLSHVIGLVKKH